MRASDWTCIRTKESASNPRRNCAGRLTRPFSSNWWTNLPMNLFTPQRLHLGRFPHFAPLHTAKPHFIGPHPNSSTPLPPPRADTGVSTPRAADPTGTDAGCGSSFRSARFRFLGRIGDSRRERPVCASWRRLAARNPRACESHVQPAAHSSDPRDSRKRASSR